MAKTLAILPIQLPNMMLYFNGKGLLFVSALVLAGNIAFAQRNEQLVRQLDSIYATDQQYRSEMEAVQGKYGGKSPEMRKLLGKMHIADSINEMKVVSILDKYGWPGAEVVGKKGSSAIFLVIQHAEPATQEKYLPVMRTAVKDKKASAADLALLEDRVALRQGKQQQYGSQIGWNMETNEYYVLPLADPDQVDERRAKMGLEPMAAYLSEVQLKWDPEQFKKEQVEREMKAKEQKKK